MSNEFQAAGNTPTADCLCVLLYADSSLRSTRSPSELVCIPLMQCGIGTERELAPTATSDSHCRQCGPGTYRNIPNLTRSSTQTICKFDSESESNPASVTADRVYEALRNCDLLDEIFESGGNDDFELPREFYYSAHSPTTDRSYLEATGCGIGYGVIVPLSLILDSECEPSNEITSYRDRPKTEPCACDRTECPKNDHGVSQSTVSSDRICAPATRCDTSGETQYQLTAPSITVGRVCATATLCDPSQVEVYGLTSTTDRIRATCDGVNTFNDGTGSAQCQAITLLYSDSYENMPPTVTSDRQCR